jgi:serine/threonine protein kinase
LIHDRIPKITDFGAGKQLGVRTNYKNGTMGAICYLDPQRCGNQGYIQDYKLEKPSDIYSLGVIFWQIFSVRTPFEAEK